MTDPDAQVRWLIHAAQKKDAIAQLRIVPRTHYAEQRKTAFVLREMARDGLRNPSVIAGVPEA